MSESIILLILTPMICMLCGGILAIFFQPSEKITSLTQHFAAGVVFAAVAKELVVKLGAAHSSMSSLIIGFSLGVLCMVMAKFVSHKLEERQSELAVGFILAILIDVIMDGLLIGLAFLSGEKGGTLITIALSIEIAFLGIATSATLNAKNMSKIFVIGMIIILALAIPIASLAGFILFKNATPDFMNGTIAFGTSALLYLVTEELLVEAHKIEEKSWMSIFFFLGFLLILILES